jgi:hypothetical protein
MQISESKGTAALARRRPQNHLVVRQDIFLPSTGIGFKGADSGSYAVTVLSRRFGLSATVAALVAELAGLAVARG